MKKLFTILSFFTLSSSFFTLHSQNWVNMMLDPNTNVHDVQAAFYKWYGIPPNPQKGIPEHEGGYELFKRWENFMVPRTYPTGNRNDMKKLLSDYLDYKTQYKEKTADKKSLMQTSNWTYSGTVGVPINGGGDGRVNRVRFYPGNTNIIYACAPTGGLWKSIDGGITWATNTDQLTSIGTSDIAIDPVNPAIMYLAMGDDDGGVAFTTGVLKSTDTGKTWNPTGLSYTLQASGPGSYEANQLLINPDSTNVIFAAMNIEPYRSRDSGNTWTDVLSSDIRSVEFEPFHSNVIYASSEYGLYYRSSDGGNSFTLVSNGLPNRDVNRMTIGVSPADSNRVYILAENKNTNGFYGLYMSTDRGQTFTTQSTLYGGTPNLLGWSPVGNDSTGQGWYTLALAVSQTNADTILVGGVNLWMSGNHGVNWTLNADWTGTDAPYVHADIHHITYYPGSGSSYITGCDGGVFNTINKGTAWTDLSNNLEIGELYSIGLSALTPGRSISGWQDNGSNISGAPWEQTVGGDGQVDFIGYTNDWNLFASVQNGYILYSSDRHTMTATLVILEQGAWTTPWLQDPQQPSIVYAGFENLWETQPPSFIWTQMSTWEKTGEYINSIAIAPSYDGFIYASHSDSLMATYDFGFSWKCINGTLPVKTVSINAVTVDPSDSARIWAVFSGFNASFKVFKSEDAGNTWTNISSGLPNLPINCIVCQPNTPEGIYIGTDIGVYYHDTVLNAWVSYNNGLPNVEVRDLKIGASNTLVAATYGRGVWQTATYIATGINQLNIERVGVTVYPNPTTGWVNVVIDGTEPGEYTLSVSDILGHVVYVDKINITDKCSKNLDLSGKAQGVYLLTIAGKNSKTVKKIVVY